MNDLRRELAPVTEAAWRAIDDEAKRTLTTYLAARKLVDFDGPKGWDVSAVNVGRSRALEHSPAEGVAARVRTVQPLVELRAEFELSHEELDNVNRGAADPDLDPLVGAARQLAAAEDRLVFDGYDAAGVTGLVGGSEHEPVVQPEDFMTFPRTLAQAIETLRETGISGPYALALGPVAYNKLSKTTGSGGYPILLHVKRLIDGPIVWTPTLDGAVLISQRGDDFRLVVGRDVSIGYLDHHRESVRLYLEESLTFRLLTPEAAVPIALHNP
ncbi:MAG: family 1 encapsulin nanocompartment shell protein [Planctomycetaceae bacterium]